MTARDFRWHKRGETADRSAASESSRMQLPADPDADRGEGAIETDGLGFSRVVAYIHRTEEEIAAIAHTDFRIGEFKRQAGKTTDIGYCCYAVSIKSNDWSCVVASWPVRIEEMA